MSQKAFYFCSINIAVYQLVAHQSVSIGRDWVNRQEKGQSVLIDFVHTKNVGELAHDPGLIVGSKFDLVEVWLHYGRY